MTKKATMITGYDHPCLTLFHHHWMSTDQSEHQLQIGYSIFPKKGKDNDISNSTIMYPVVFLLSLLQLSFYNCIKVMSN